MNRWAIAIIGVFTLVVITHVYNQYSQCRELGFSQSTCARLLDR